MDYTTNNTEDSIFTYLLDRSYDNTINNINRLYTMVHNTILKPKYTEHINKPMQLTRSIDNDLDWINDKYIEMLNVKYTLDLSSKKILNFYK